MSRSKEAQPSSPCIVSVCKEKSHLEMWYKILMQEKTNNYSFTFSFKTKVLTENMFERKRFHTFL